MTIPTNTEINDVLYRAHAYVYSDEGGHGHSVVLDMDTWWVHKLTPQGAWLKRSKWSPKPSTWRSFNTKFVWVTKDEAEESLKRRSFARLDHARRRVKEAQAVMSKLGLTAKQDWETV